MNTIKDVIVFWTNALVIHGNCEIITEKNDGRSTWESPYNPKVKRRGTRGKQLLLFEDEQ